MRITGAKTPHVAKVGREAKFLKKARFKLR
jgi:hypothetical protein